MDPAPIHLGMSLGEVEKEYIKMTLALGERQQNESRFAIGISRRALYNKLGALSVNQVHTSTWFVMTIRVCRLQFSHLESTASSNCASVAQLACHHNHSFSSFKRKRLFFAAFLIGLFIAVEFFAAHRANEEDQRWNQSN
jgi:hypothetical protein